MSTEAMETIPARRGKAARVRKGQRIKMINTHGNTKPTEAHFQIL
jgi:uncharacterized protein YcgI (DUF1989 family)